MKVKLLIIFFALVFISCQSKEDSWFKNAGNKFYTNTKNQSILFIADKVLVGDEKTIIDPLGSLITLATTYVKEIKSKNEAVYTMEFFGNQDLNFTLEGNTLNALINGEDIKFYYNDELTKKYYTNITAMQKWIEEYNATNTK
ncbi:hypothetical protein [Brachyspira intermedia]|uniref:hypothetical protein n=1 Tax=Brachyspira intermedia TaxID=84377 RepID=UPI003003E2BD